MGGASKVAPECQYEATGFKKYFNFDTLRGKTRAHIIVGLMMFTSYNLLKYKLNAPKRRLAAQKEAQAIEDRRLLEEAKDRWLANGKRFLD